MSTKRYLSATEVAQRLGITVGAWSGYVRKGLTPEPDATIGRVSGWLPATIDKWNANRPGRGARTDLT